jgi:tetratricopeptide (TPR) repeat protein
MLGRYDEALAEIEADGEFPSPRRWYYQFRALLLSRVGRAEEAQDQVPLMVETVDDAGFLSFSETLLALLAFERQDYAQVVAAIGRAERHLTQLSREPQKTDGVVVAHLLAGAAEARLGNLGAARKHLEAQSEFDLEPAHRKWWHAALAGEIALAEGDLAAAESLFARGEPAIKLPQFRWHITNVLPFRDGPARVKALQGDLAGAIELYRALNRPDAANKWTAMLEPRYVLELARLLDETGEKDAAREEYERFLELWKDADPGHPELVEAQAYVAR